MLKIAGFPDDFTWLANAAFHLISVSRVALTSESFSLSNVEQSGLTHFILIVFPVWDFLSACVYVV